MVEDQVTLVKVRRLHLYTILLTKRLCIIVGTQFESLSHSRLMIMFICTSYLSKAITIGVRYAAVRKQFGPTEDSELPIIEYQLTVSVKCRVQHIE